MRNIRCQPFAPALANTSGAGGVGLRECERRMRRADIRATMNIYGDAASADMREAQGKIVQLALQPE